MPLGFERDCVREGRRRQCERTSESSTKDICVHALHQQAGQRQYRLTRGIQRQLQKMRQFHCYQQQGSGTINLLFVRRQIRQGCKPIEKSKALKQQLLSNMLLLLRASKTVLREYVPEGKGRSIRREEAKGIAKGFASQCRISFELEPRKSAASKLASSTTIQGKRR